MIHIKKLWNASCVVPKNRRIWLSSSCTALGCTVERKAPPEIRITQLSVGEPLIEIPLTRNDSGRIGGQETGSDRTHMAHICVRLETLMRNSILAHLASHGIKENKLEIRYGAKDRPVHFHSRYGRKYFGVNSPPSG